MKYIIRRTFVTALAFVTVVFGMSVAGKGLENRDNQLLKLYPVTTTSILLGSAIRTCTPDIPACQTCEKVMTDCHVEIDNNGEGNVYGNEKNGGTVNVPAISCQEDDPCWPGNTLPHTN